MRFKVLTRLRMSLVVSLAVATDGLAGRHRRFGEKYYLHLTGFLVLDTVGFSSETLVSTCKTTQLYDL